MPAGIQIWNADGSLQFDTSNRLFRVLTQEDIGGANTGSRTVTGVQGTLGAVVTPVGTTGTPPTVTVSGNTVSWDYKGAASRQAANVTYMEY